MSAQCQSDQCVNHSKSISCNLNERSKFKGSSINDDTHFKIFLSFFYFCKRVSLKGESN